MAPAIESADIYRDAKGRRIDIFVFAAHCDICHMADRLLGADV